MLQQSEPKEMDNLLLILFVPRKKRKSEMQIKQKWSKASRGKKGRVKKGVELAAIHKYRITVHNEARTILKQL